MGAGQIRTGFSSAALGSCSGGLRAVFLSVMSACFPSWSDSPWPTSHFMYILCGQWTCGSWSRATGRAWALAWWRPSLACGRGRRQRGECRAEAETTGRGGEAGVSAGTHLASAVPFSCPVPASASI